VPAAGEDRKFVVFGALDYATGRLLWRLGPRKDAAAFVDFLDYVAAELPGDRLVLALDNVGYHKARLARSWWVEHRDRVQPFWLPAWTPELNLLERVWRHLKDKLACHRHWADLAGLQRATAALLDRLEAHFHQHDAPAIRLAQDFRETA
jgi:transposase